MKPITQRSNTRNTAHAKISVAKITPTVTFTTRDNVDTPPAITPYVIRLAPFMKNHNETTAHATTAKALINHVPAFMTERPMPLWVCASAPVNGKDSGKIYTAHSNIRTADKPAFRHDSMYLFDILSEDYSA